MLLPLAAFFLTGANDRLCYLDEELGCISEDPLVDLSLYLIVGWIWILGTNQCVPSFNPAGVREVRNAAELKNQNEAFSQESSLTERRQHNFEAEITYNEAIYTNLDAEEGLSNHDARLAVKSHASSVIKNGQKQVFTTTFHDVEEETRIFLRYTLWNGFIGLTNILELSNPEEFDAKAEILFYNIDGSLGEVVSLELPSKRQVDIVLNDLESFSADSYGVVIVQSTLQNIDGRVTYYRSSEDEKEFEFAFAVPVANPLFGPSGVIYNTYQPSLNVQEADHLVANWLSVVNLHPFEERSFVIEKRDQLGELVSDPININLGPFQRFDVEAGHVDPGPNNVGGLFVRPKDNSTNYIAQLMRYGLNAPAGIKETGYSFAFLLEALNGSPSPLVVPISNSIGNGDYPAQNWLEVLNIHPVEIDINITFTNEDGELLETRSLNNCAICTISY